MRRKRKSKRVAPSVVLFTKQKNDNGVMQTCVYAQCTYGGTQVGPCWGHSVASVRAVMTQLSLQCDCGRERHHRQFTEGEPTVRPRA